MSKPITIQTLPSPSQQLPSPVAILNGRYQSPGPLAAGYYFGMLSQPCIRTVASLACLAAPLGPLNTELGASRFQPPRSNFPEAPFKPDASADPLAHPFTNSVTTHQLFNASGTSTFLGQSIHFDPGPYWIPLFTSNVAYSLRQSWEIYPKMPNHIPTFILEPLPLLLRE